jgi:hypothetical protein
MEKQKITHSSGRHYAPYPEKREKWIVRILTKLISFFSWTKEAPQSRGFRLFKFSNKDVILFYISSYDFKVCFICFKIIFTPARKACSIRFFYEYFKYFSFLRSFEIFSCFIRRFIRSFLICSGTWFLNFPAGTDSPIVCAENGNACTFVIL